MGFFALGAIIASATAVALHWPGTRLEPMWHLNPSAHTAFLAMGAWAVPLMLGVAVTCALAAIGLWRRARWGYRIALALLVVNLVGDASNALVRGDLRTLIGLPIGGLLIGYLLTGAVRSQFAAPRAAA